MDRVITKDDVISTHDLLAGAALLVDKPMGWTSFDVVNKLRWGLKHKSGIKRYKVGHAGTLDPLATGLLIICIAKYTKLADAFQAKSKSYTGSIRLFETTPTYDAEMLPDTYYPEREFSSAALESATTQFIGDIQQLPPIYSAIKKNGVALYKLARKGKQIEVQPRDITISTFDITNVDLPEVSFEVDCSKGTYIRSLAYDYGRALGTGAYLSSLRRTAIGEYNVSDAWALDKLITHISELESASDTTNQ